MALLKACSRTLGQAVLNKLEYICMHEQCIQLAIQNSLNNCMVLYIEKLYLIYDNDISDICQVSKSFKSFTSAFKSYKFIKEDISPRLKKVFTQEITNLKTDILFKAGIWFNFFITQ